MRGAGHSDADDVARQARRGRCTAPAPVMRPIRSGDAVEAVAVQRIVGAASEQLLPSYLVCRVADAGRRRSQRSAPGAAMRPSPQPMRVGVDSATRTMRVGSDADWQMLLACRRVTEPPWRSLSHVAIRHHHHDLTISDPACLYMVPILYV
jgi:hypothetical protein